jgi:predicted PurR-regulated permease PerM
MSGPYHIRMGSHGQPGCVICIHISRPRPVVSDLGAAFYWHVFCIYINIMGAGNSRKHKLSMYLLLFLILVAGSIFFYTMRIFIIPLITSLVFAALVYPLFTRFARLFPKRRGIASLIFCFLIILALFVPLYFIGRLVFDQAQSFYTTIQSEVGRFVGEGKTEGIWEKITGSRIVRWLEAQKLNWKSWLESAVNGISSVATEVVNRTSSGVFRTLAGIFVFLFSQFYLLRDNDRIRKSIRSLSPLDPEYEEKLIDKFKLIARATILGTIVIGTIQGTIGAATFLLIGVDAWLLWGIIMLVLAIIPFVGIYFVMLPAAVYYFIIGDVIKGIILLIVGTAVNWLVDYFIRPWFVGRESRVHDLLIFFSTVGGIFVFGIMGFIVGPVILAVFLTLLEIYRLEFKPEG